MRVNFLGATDSTRLSKTFEEIAPGKYKEESYPFISKFNSIERQVHNAEEFHGYIVACADEGLCLLKGELDRPLSNESRAGHTDASAPTSWICLDVDYTVKDRTPPEFLEALGFADVSFVFQKSSSMGIKASSFDAHGWRGHFFILLDSPQSPQALKQWLIQANLGSSFLLPNIGLSASGGASASGSSHRRGPRKESLRSRRRGTPRCLPRRVRCHAPGKVRTSLRSRPGSGPM